MGAPPDPEPFAPFATLQTRHVYRSDWCNLRRDVVDLGDGTRQEYHVFEVPDAAVVVPVLEDGRIVLIAQYRYPHGRTHWEVPAGRLAPAERLALGKGNPSLPRRVGLRREPRLALVAQDAPLQRGPHGLVSDSSNPSAVRRSNSSRAPRAS